MRAILLLALMIIGTFGYSQTNINGNVVDQNNEPIPGANIVIVGKTIGTVTDFDGNFNLATSEVPPFKIEISSIGYTSTTENITSASQTITITLNESQTFLDEVVISASRTPERIFESPVTVERIGVSEIKNTLLLIFMAVLKT